MNTNFRYKENFKEQIQICKKQTLRWISIYEAVKFYLTFSNQAIKIYEFMQQEKLHPTSVWTQIFFKIKISDFKVPQRTRINIYQTEHSNNSLIFRIFQLYNLC